jgi:hypothetical protein
MQEDIFNSKEIKKIFGLNKRKSEKLVQVFEAMLSARNCNLTKISGLLQTKNRPESDYRGMQRFFAGTQLCEKECAKLIWSALGIGMDEKVIVILDRTYWMKGKTHLNFLYLSVFYKGYGMPIFFKMLPDKKGHSNVADRKELLNKFINEFGKDRIQYVVADREFDGNEWLSHLKDSEIGYVQRLKENTICMSNSRGKMVRAKDLCHQIGVGEKESFGERRIYKSHNFHTNITVTRSSKGKVVMLAHSEGIDDPTYAYGFRWGIEVGFRAMKTGGFNIEDTGLTHPSRITTLYRIIAILTALSYKGGMLIEDIMPIKIRSHGRKSVSSIKLFLDFIAACKHKVTPAFKPIIRKLKTTLQLPFLLFCRVL